MPVNGTFFDPMAKGSSQFTPPDMTYGVPTAMFNLQISEYVLNTFMEAAASTGEPIDISEIYIYGFNVNLTTNKLGFIIPQIVNKYGNKQVEMKIIVLPYSQVEMSNDRIYASVNL